MKPLTLCNPRSGFRDRHRKIKQVVQSDLYIKGKCQKKSSGIWLGSHFSHRHFLNPSLMSFPSYKFCKFPLEHYRVRFMKMSSASAAITHTLAIMCTMQNGSNSGENENQQSSLGMENKAIFFHLPSTQPSRP